MIYTVYDSVVVVKIEEKMSLNTTVDDIVKKFRNKEFHVRFNLVTKRIEFTVNFSKDKL